MSKRTETMTIRLSYIDGIDEPKKNVFRSAVADPAYANELLLWVERQEEVDSEETHSQQVNLCGTRRALHELGCYLVALSRFKTEDVGYHDHFDELSAPKGKSTCELLIHSPSRLKGGE